ncbi:MAG: caspase family protein [Candidatus Cloacimonadaceae bacterium]|nr:caspase family protein [Candidatus Cloacimonadaceae bacterium]
MKRIGLALLLMLLLSFAFGARKALVIGNADYAGSALRNPVNDANLIAEKLGKLGFEVALLLDANLQSMENGLNAFVTGLSAQDEALFYYSGHGANVNGENFLIPVGTSITEEIELKYRAFSCNLAMEKLQRAKISIIVLDACRDNPYKGVRSGNKGLAMMQGKAGSQYLIYSTEQGRTAADGGGQNSPFTLSFAKYISEPQKIEDIMKKVTLEVKTITQEKQIPWTAGNLIEDFYFVPAGKQPAQSYVDPASGPKVVIDGLSISDTGVQIQYRSDRFADYSCKLIATINIMLKGGTPLAVPSKPVIMPCKAGSGENTIAIASDVLRSHWMSEETSKIIDTVGNDVDEDTMFYRFEVEIYDANSTLLHSRAFETRLIDIEKAIEQNKTLKL